MRPSLNGNRLMPSQTKNASRYSCACNRADASESGRKCSLYRCTQPQGQGLVVDYTGCRMSVPACNQRLHQGRSPAQPRTQGSWLLTRVRSSAEQNWLVADIHLSTVQLILSKKIGRFTELPTPAKPMCCSPAITATSDS